MTRFSVGREEGGPRMRLQLISDSDQDEPTYESFNSTHTQPTLRSTDVPNADHDFDNAGREVSSTPRNQSQVPPAITELGNNRAVNNAAQAVNNVVNNGVEEEGSQVMTLSDPDVLDCPICLNPLSIPVYQCENGHVTCSSCSSKVRNKCPSCTFPIGYNRCRAIEKVIESVKISCRNMKYGCMEKTSYCYKNAHDNMCTYAPCLCPESYCQFIGSVKQLSEHFTLAHRHTAKRFCFDIMSQILIRPLEKQVILQEDGGLLFIINNRKFQSLGNLITISCVQPSTSKKYSYTVVATIFECSLKMKSVADNMPTGVENVDWKNSLMVPQHYVDSLGELILDINIKNGCPQSPPRR